MYEFLSDVKCSPTRKMSVCFVDITGALDSACYPDNCQKEAPATGDIALFGHEAELHCLVSNREGLGTSL